MTTEEINKLWGEDLYRVFGGHIDEEGWLTSDWSGILENEVPRLDRDYNDNPEYSATYNRMYLLEFEESEYGSKIRPLIEKTNIDKLRERDPELLAEFESMDRNQLLEACCGEVIDLLDHNDRVQLFMNECTDMSKTNYTLDALKTMIADKKQQELSEWCQDLVDEYGDQEIAEEVKKEADKLA